MNVFVGGCLTALILSATYTVSGKELKLTPARMEQHFVTPGNVSQFDFRAEGIELSERLEGELLDFTGKRFASAELTLDREQQRYRGNFTLPAGFYELSVPAAKVRFGIVSLRENREQRDLFWGINLNSKPGVEGMFRILDRFGIQSVRRWHSYENEEKTPGKWSATEETGYDFAAAAGMSLLIYNNRVPVWMRTQAEQKKVNALPASILSLSPSVETMLERRRNVMGGYQLRNEPDLKTVPGDAYIPYFAANSYLAAKVNLALPVVGCGFGSWFNRIDSKQWRVYLDSGMLDLVDIFAFHNYSAPESLWPHIRDIRRILAPYPKAAMPLWITECGKPWSRGISNPKSIYGGPGGNSRAEVGDDLTSARWIVAKACFARAAGIERCFVFILNFHPENTTNFGQLDQNNTPHRSLGAYLFAAGHLASLEYRGDAKVCPSGAERVLLFSDGKRHVGVVLGKDEEALLMPAPAFPVQEFHALDGSRIVPNAKGEIHLLGITYLTLPELPEINRDTEGMRLLELARSYRPVPRHTPPAILSFDSSDISACSGAAYFAVPKTLAFSAANLSDAALTITPELRLPPGGKILTGPGGPVTLPARSETCMEYTVDLTAPEIPAGFRVELRDSSGTANHLSLPFFNLDKCRLEEFSLADAKRWKANSSGHMTVEYDEAEQAVKIHADFTGVKGNRWAEPQYELRLPAESLDGSIGISFDIKAKQQKGAKFFLYSVVGFNFGDGTQITTRFRPAPTEAWERRLVIWPDSLALENVRKLRIGLGPSDDQLDYWIRNIKLHYLPNTEKEIAQP